MLELIFLGNPLKNYLIALSIIILFIGIGKIFSLIIVKILKKIAAKTKTMLDDIVIKVIEKPFVFLLFNAGFYVAGWYVNFSERGKSIYFNINEILLVIAVVWMLIKFLDAMIEQYLKPLAAKSESQLDDNMLPFARTLIKVTMIIIAAIFLIKRFGYDVTSLVAGLGIGGLAFALAAQSLLGNLFGGVAIIADKPFHVGDRIRVDQKYDGVVKEIGMRSTTITTPNDTLMTVPNSIIASNVVENFSHNPKHAIRITFNLGLVYNTTNEKIRKAISIVKSILNENKNIMHDGSTTQPTVVFNEFKDSSLNIYVAYSFVPGKDTPNLRNDINLKIKEEFETNGIEFAFPTQTINLNKN